MYRFYFPNLRLNNRDFPSKLDLINNVLSILKNLPSPSPKFSPFATRLSSYSSALLLSLLLFIVFPIISAVAASPCEPFRFGTFYTTLLITEINGET
ncbi:hypothetical protein L2E82_03934 [Cichorium intybus]|uniref:Uncharacterized protein n=1 Tax=Cichorium intybus TaxID=13427 RepID=A0ACB9H592_CICIN|nr:hypothetical protein L2E82_03934 [Cichorium intybus]